MTKSDAVLERLAALDGRRAQLIDMQVKVGTKLLETRKDAAEAFLETSDESGLHAIGDLENKLDVISRSLDLLELKRADIEVDLKAATAADFRLQVTAKQTELSELESKTAPLLRELSRIEGITFNSGILSAQRSGLWHVIGNFMLDPVPEHMGSYIDCVPATTNMCHYETPRSRRLRVEIADLEAKASEIEQSLEREKEEQRPAPSPSGSTLYGAPVKDERMLAAGSRFEGTTGVHVVTK